jgi:hypothetical protein
MNKEQLANFADEYAIVDQAASSLFDRIEKLEQKYSSGYREKYYYDRFTLDNGYYFELHGSYSYQGGSGSISHDMYVDEFADSDEFMRNYENELENADLARKEKEKTRQAAKDAAEYVQFLKLQEKYTNKG